MMAFIGVRISWLMFARNSLLARVASSALPLRALQLPDELGELGRVPLLRRARLLQLLRGAPQLHLADDLAAQGLERLLLHRGQGLRSPVDDAQRAEAVPFRIDQRRSRVEANARLPAHQGVVREPLVPRRIGDDEEVALENRMGAERDVPRRLLHVDAQLRLEPLPVGVHEAHHGDGSPADLGGQQDEVVEVLLGKGVEEVIAAQGLEAGFLIRGNGRPHHLGLSPGATRAASRKLSGPVKSALP
jgi:hypothetical protein